MVIYKLALNLAVALAIPVPFVAQPKVSNSQAIFEGSTDVGVTQKGSTVSDPPNGSYRVTGGGDDMWGSADSFHLSWVRLSGDATLTADVHFAQGDWHPRAKAVLIFRQSLQPSSVYADVAIHHDGHIALQYRATSGAPTEDTTAPQHNSVRLRIGRKGNTFTAYAESSDGKMVAFGSKTIVLHDPVYVGIGVCAHNANGLNTATFSNIQIQQGHESATASK